MAKKKSLGLKQFDKKRNSDSVNNISELKF